MSAMAGFLRRQGLLITASILLAAGGAGAYLALKSPTYVASASIGSVSPADAGAEVVTSARVARRVAASVRGYTSVQALEAVETSADPEANVVTIETSADSGELAARLANSFAHEARDVLASDDRRVTVEDVATVPEDPDSPRPALVIGLALGIGLIVGLIAALVRNSGRGPETDSGEVPARTPIPGSTGAEGFDNAEIISNGDRGPDDRIEIFNILRSNLDFLSPEKAPRVVGITSPLAEEGKSTVTAGLAAASAIAGKRTLIVECDLRRPVLANRFEIPSEPGLVDWIAGNASPADVLQHVDIDGRTELTKTETSPRPLDIVVSGGAVPRPSEFLGSSRFEEFLAEVRELYDLVLLDCAPLLLVGDTLEVIPQLDAVLICIRLAQTTAEQAHAAKAAVDHFPPRPTALVVTGQRPGTGSDYDYGYYGYYGSPPSEPSRS